MDQDKTEGERRPSQPHIFLIQKGDKQDKPSTEEERNKHYPQHNIKCSILPAFSAHVRATIIYDLHGPGVYKFHILVVGSTSDRQEDTSAVD